MADRAKAAFYTTLGQAILEALPTISSAIQGVSEDVAWLGKRRIILDNLGLDVGTTKIEPSSEGGKQMVEEIGRKTMEAGAPEGDLVDLVRKPVPDIGALMAPGSEAQIEALRQAGITPENFDATFRSDEDFTKWIKDKVLPEYELALKARGLEIEAAKSERVLKFQHEKQMEYLEKKHALDLKLQQTKTFGMERKLVNDRIKENDKTLKDIGIRIDKAAGEIAKFRRDAPAKGLKPEAVTEGIKPFQEKIDILNAERDIVMKDQTFYRDYLARLEGREAEEVAPVTEKPKLPLGAPTENMINKLKDPKFTREEKEDALRKLQETYEIAPEALKLFQDAIASAEESRKILGTVAAPLPLPRTGIEVANGGLR